MATNTAQPTTFSPTDKPKGDVWAGVKKVLKPLASLRLTVVLFALSIVLVLAGTLAQDTMGIEQVKETYFKVWVTWLNLQLLFPAGFFPQGSPVGSFDLWLVFPGGKTLGLLMLLNLLAAHTVRFNVQARGPRLGIGLGVIGIGMVVTWLVIASGMNTDTLYEPILNWEKIWYLLLSSLAALTLVSIYGAFTVPPNKKLLSWLLIALAAALLAATVWLAMRTWYQGVEHARLEAPSMRILWQLLKGTFAGVVLLVGCILAFKKRAGIVLLHGGVALLMISELMVNLQAEETRITLFEGESTNYSYSIQEVELAVVDPLDEETERVVVIPQHMLKDSAGRITHEDLPFDVEVVRFYPNSDILGPAQARQQEVEDFANAGTAHSVGIVAVERGQTPGTQSEINLPSAYIRLFKKGSEEEIGTYLLGVFQSRLFSMGSSRPTKQEDDAERISVDGHDPYLVSLRFKRTYHPYEVELTETGRTNYVGTNTPSDYFSRVVITDPSRHTDFPYRIWMNNPLRYAGHTFYQSGHTILGDKSEFSTLQVVKNTSWMIPYVSCMIVGVGMLFQFCLTLSRFLNRQQGVLLNEKQNATAEEPEDAEVTTGADGRPVHTAKRAGAQQSARRFDPMTLVLGCLLVALCGYWVVKSSVTPVETDDAFNYYAAGQIPVVYGGRIQPLDSLARNQLRIIQGKQTFQAAMSSQELAENWDDVRADLLAHWPDLDPAELSELVSTENDTTSLDDLTLFIAEKTGEAPRQVQRVVEIIATTKQPALRWMFDIMVRPELASKHRVFRIENVDLIDQLELEHRSGLRYSFNELMDIIPGDELAAEAGAGEPEIENQIPLLRELASIDNVKDEELTFYQRKLRELERNLRRYRMLSDATYLTVPGNSSQEKMAWLNGLLAQQPPLFVSPAASQEEVGLADWQLLPVAAEIVRRQRAAQLDDEVNESVVKLSEIYTAYALGETKQFNSAVDSYLSMVDRASLSPSENDKLSREVYFNYFEPFFLAAVLYFSAFLVITVYWLTSGMSTYDEPIWVKRHNQEPSLFKRFFNPESLRLAALAVIGLALLVHSWALWQRMAISGRPPVTNLYSSAVFIGWAGVVLGIVLEFLFRRGFGIVIVAWTGFSTLLIANFLSGSGDTFTVMQAVLDTQFWLATHVVCVTLGYATTFLSGSLGIAYIAGGLFIPRFSRGPGKDLARMVYGTLCFAIFFSFVGTVLGGLWADDSWGRFWGWDPKENGALIIVLWNALVLHARWAGMVRDRGLAVLAVAGNITTAWSWFGVNQLGIGLHSYGFTEGMLAILGLWCLSQLIAIAAGSIPTRYWAGFKEKPTPTGT